MVIQALRDNMPKWITGVILVIIIGPFALWGINSYFTASTDSSVATVNGDEITPGDFQRAYQGQYERLQQFYGPNFRPGMIDEKQLQQQVLDNLINETLLNQQVAKQHYSVGDQQLVESIQKIPAFQVAGKFSAQAYSSALAASGMSPAEFENRDRQGIEVGQVQDSIEASAIVTPSEFANEVAAREQQREISYIDVSTVYLLGSQQVSDADVAAYYKAHGQEFMTPEKVTLAYVDLDEANLAKQVTPPTDADLQAMYEQEIDSFKQGETRNARHILIAVNGKDPQADAAAKAKAEDVLKQLKAGGDFAKLAAKYSDDPGSKNQGGDLGKVSRGVMVKPFEDALFALKKPGDIAGPVRTQFGYHIIQLEGINVGSVKPFSEVKAQLAADYAKKKADDQYFSMGDQLANLAYEHPDSLDDVSKQLNLPIQTVDDVTRDYGTGIAANPDVRAAAFSESVLGQGNNSEPIQLGPNHAIVVRVKGHVPSMPKSLDEVRSQIYSILKQQRASEAAAKLAASLVLQVQKGADPAALVRQNGKGVSYVPPAYVGRSQEKVPAQILTAAFQAPDPTVAGRSVETVALDNGDQAVLLVTAMKPGDASTLKNPDKAKQMQDLARADGSAEFGAYLAYLRQQAKIKINTKNMEQGDQ